MILGLGWCGTSAQNGPTVAADPDVGNYVVIDLRAPTIIRGFRTQGVQRLDGRLAYPSAIREDIEMKTFCAHFRLNNIIIDTYLLLMKNIKISIDSY